MGILIGSSEEPSELRGRDLRIDHIYKVVKICLGSIRVSERRRRKEKG